MYVNYGQNDLAKTHRYELECEAERQRLADSALPKRNVLRLAINKLGVLLVWLGTWMKQGEHIEQSPTPITGKL
jgi:hypothetical protein